MKEFIRRYTSRRFLLSVANLVTMIAVAFNYNTETVAQITALILAAGGVIAFIIGQSNVEAHEIHVEEVQEDA